eukprot:2081457-Rhodomonas_salina.2
MWSSSQYHAHHMRQTTTSVPHTAHQIRMCQRKWYAPKSSGHGIADSRRVSTGDGLGDSGHATHASVPEMAWAIADMLRTRQYRRWPRP